MAILFPHAYYCVQVDGNADHVGPKLFETRTRIDAKQASKQVPLKGLMRRKTMERVGDERFEQAAENPFHA